MRSQVPWLSVVVKILQDTQQLMQDLIDKVYEPFTDHVTIEHYTTIGEGV